MAAESNLKNMTLVLGLTCLLCSAVLGGAYALTKKPIDAAAVAKTNKAVGAVLPAFDETSYESVEVDGKTYNYYKAVKGGETVGYAVESTVVGFGGPLSLMVGVTPDGVVYNTSVLSHSETPGLGAKCNTDAKFMAQWDGKASTLPPRFSPSRRTAATWTPSRLPPSPPAPTRKPSRTP